MIEAERAVARLTQEHTELIDGQTATCDPLLVMLWEARYPSLGKTVGGSGTGTPIDTHAIDLYEHIDGAVRSWLTHFREHSTGDLLPLVGRLLEVIKAEEAGGRLEDRDRMFGMFAIFVQKIEDKFDPPIQKELIGQCPDCGETHIENEDGDLERAVRMTVRPGRALVAECHSCKKLWVGQDSLIGLAETMGAEIDWVTLREVIDTPK